MSLKSSIKMLRKQFQTVRIFFFLRNQYDLYNGGTLASTFYYRRDTDLQLQQNTLPMAIKFRILVDPCNQQK